MTTALIVSDATKQDAWDAYDSQLEPHRLKYVRALDRIRRREDWSHAERRRQSREARAVFAGAVTIARDEYCRATRA